MKFWKDKEMYNSIIEKFIGENELIKYDDLDKLPFNTLISILPNAPEDIQTLKLDNKEDNSLTFRVTMKKGSKWTKHRHDCKETIVLYKGILEDDITSIHLERGGFIVIPPHKTHSFTAIEDSTFYVEFEKPRE